MNASIPITQGGAPGSANSPASAMHERGTKYTCADTSCQTKFYDLNKESPVCPKCGQAIVKAKPAAARKARTKRD